MTDYDQQPYVIVEKHGTGITAFFLGAFVGAATALLLAPKSGRETQQELREGARRLREGAEERFTDLRKDVEEGYEKARGEIEERVDSARDNIRDRRHRAEEALKAGKDAAKRARSDLEQRVAESKAAYKAALDEGDRSDDGTDAASKKKDEKEEAEASS
ncbi:MAG: YtxH domain-containing protein [Gemmatimonadota bacterium]|nr:YtxH domain-containing protein [Gemmatimonadota bacterium]